MFATTLERIAMDVTQRIMHIDPDFLRRQQEAMIQAREQELARMRQAQFLQPSEPTGALGGVMAEQEQEEDVGIPMQAQPARAMSQSGSRPRPMLQSGPQTGRPAAGPAVELKNVGRNDPCPCASGKKFKKCHGTVV